MTKFSPLQRGRKILLLGAMLALSIAGISQNPSIKVFEDWNTVSATQNNFQRSVVRAKTLGGATYYYTCGSTLNASGNYDLFVQKKNASGTILWSQTYNGAGNGNDYASDVQVDNVGNVYICGTYYKDATDSNNTVVIKYNTAGTHKWTKTYNGTGSGHDGFAAMQVQGNVVVAVGTTWKGLTNMYDMLAIRYDSLGNVVWTQTWNYSNLNDVAINLYNKGTSIYIAGGAQSAITTYKYAVVTIKASDGSVLGSAVTGGTAFGFDQLTDLQYDLNGNIYITGGVLDVATGYNIKTVKLDSMLNILWSQTYTSTGANNDIGTGIAVDQVGNVIVTGYKTSSTTGQDYVTIKYSSAGTQRWIATYEGGFNEQDSASAVVVSPTDTNKIYVTGCSYNGSSKDYWTIKYDGAGNQKWGIGFNNLSNTDDRALAIALDTSGNVIVEGQNKLAWNSHTYTTVRYIEKSVLLPDDTIPQTSNSFIYTENRGQIWGTDSATHPEIKYYVINSMPKIYFMDTAVSYVFANLDTSTSSSHIDTLARVDMKFKNANSNLRIRSMDKREDYENFFLGHIPDGRSNVPNYNQLASFNVWNNVDVIYGSNLAGMKYYFVCKPGGGGNPATQIDLFYNGADSVKVDGSGQLIIYTPLGNIVQPKAAAWQLDATGNYQSLGWQPSYSIIGTNEVAFSGFGSFNTGQPLIIAIDWGNITPTTNQDNLWWSTFYGQGNHDKFKDVKVWSTGEQTAVGNTNSAFFPTFNGYQTSLNGAYAAAIVVKFDPYNVLYWATYFGGSTSTASIIYTQSETVDYDWGSTSGDIYFAGNTSTNNLPLHAWGGAYYQNTINNGCSGCGAMNDAFITKLSYDGQFLIWSTYYGGDGNEMINEIKAGEYDPNDFYIGGFTSSTNLTFPNTLPTWSDGSAFFSRFNNLGVQQWGTYIGNSSLTAGEDIVYSIATDIGASVVIVGQVGNGTSFPVQLPSSGNTGSATHAAGSFGDAFMMKLDFNTTPSNPTIVWSMYYGGTMGELAFDVVTNVYGANDKYWVVGNALKTSTNTVAPPLFNPGGGAYFDNTHNGGSLDAWILQLDLNGNIPWATFYGGNDYEYGKSVAVDIDGNVYMSGETKSTDLNTNGTFPSPNLTGAYAKTSITGVYDLYVAAFAANTYAPLWGTYYGGGNQELTSAVACYYNSTLYLTGSEAGSGTFPLYSGPGCIGSGSPYTDFGFSSTGSWKASIAGFCLGPIFPGVVENNSTLGVNVFPNPTNGIVTVAGQLSDAEDVTIEVFDVLGQIVYQQKIASTTNINTQIDLSMYGNGVYMVNVRAGENFKTEKIILQR